MDGLSTIRFCLLLFSIYFVVQVQGQAVPRITRQIEDIVARVGGSDMLNCTVANKGIHSVRWWFNNRQLTSDGQVTEDHNKELGLDKYEAFIERVDDVTQIFIIRINSLSFTDNGQYSCQIQIDNPDPNNPTPRMDVNLKVLVPPRMELSSSDITKDSFLGRNVSLNCKAIGEPSPNITWGRADGKPLPAGRHTDVMISRTGTESLKRLTLFNLVEEDRGTYRCSADNNIRPPRELYAKLGIQFPPTSQAVEPSYGAAIGENKQAMLWCQVAGNPLPSTQWYALSIDTSRQLDEGSLTLQDIDEETLAVSKELSTDSKYKIEQKIMTVGSLSTMESTFVSLNIHTMQSADLVYYACRATNQHGSQWSLIKLYQVNDIADLSRASSKSSVASYSFGLLSMTVTLALRFLC